MNKNYNRVTAAALAAFGPQRIAAETQGKKPDEVLEAVERLVFLSGIQVPGHDFSHIEKRFGSAKPLFGLRRIEVGAQQARVNETLTKLK